MRANWRLNSGPRVAAKTHAFEHHLASGLLDLNCFSQFAQFLSTNGLGTALRSYFHFSTALVFPDRHRSAAGRVAEIRPFLAEHAFSESLEGNLALSDR